MADEVAEYLIENDFHHTRNKQVVGRSQQKLYVDFEVYRGIDKLHSLAFLKVLSTTNRALTGRMVDHSLRTWLDLESVHHGTKFVTVLDDTTGDVWDDGEVRLLEDYSTVTSWSNRAELLEAISL